MQTARRSPVTGIGGGAPEEETSEIIETRLPETQILTN